MVIIIIIVVVVVVVVIEILTQTIPLILRKNKLTANFL
jgi:hypothetical protein